MNSIRTDVPKTEADLRQLVSEFWEHCGLTILRDLGPEGNDTHFLADDTDRVVVEIYTNPKADIPDYPNMHPLEFHFAFAVEQVEADRDRLIGAGVTLFEEVHLDDGSHLVMLRDPWGVPLQLCQRGRPFQCERAK